jgi:hypothetical protein
MDYRPRKTAPGECSAPTCFRWGIETATGCHTLDATAFTDYLSKERTYRGRATHGKGTRTPKPPAFTAGATPTFAWEKLRELGCEAPQTTHCTKRDPAHPARYSWPSTTFIGRPLARLA